MFPWAARCRNDPAAARVDQITAGDGARHASPVPAATPDWLASTAARHLTRRRGLLAPGEVTAPALVLTRSAPLNGHLARVSRMVIGPPPVASSPCPRSRGCPWD